MDDETMRSNSVAKWLGYAIKERSVEEADLLCYHSAANAVGVLFGLSKMRTSKTLRELLPITSQSLSQFECDFNLLAGGAIYELTSFVYFEALRMEVISYASLVLAWFDKHTKLAFPT